MASALSLQFLILVTRAQRATNATDLDTARQLLSQARMLRAEMSSRGVDRSTSELVAHVERWVLELERSLEETRARPTPPHETLSD